MHTSIHAAIVLYISFQRRHSGWYLHSLYQYTLAHSQQKAKDDYLVTLEEELSRVKTINAANAEEKKGILDAQESPPGRILRAGSWRIEKCTARVQEARIKYNPDGYNFITRNVLPRLKELGVSDETVNQIMVENPRRFFEGR